MENIKVLCFVMQYLKKELVKLNTITDTLDNSLTTRQMIKENPKVKLLRLSDRDGSWTKKYDTIYAGKHEKMSKNSSMIAIKDIENCHPYHFML